MKHTLTDPGEIVFFIVHTYNSGEYHTYQTCDNYSNPVLVALKVEGHKGLLGIGFNDTSGAASLLVKLSI